MPPEEGQNGTGQAPASDPQTPSAPAGQVPGVTPTSPTTPAPADNQGQAGQDPQAPASGKSQLTLDQALDALAKARNEAAKNRVDAKRLADLEAAQRAAEDAKLSETERLQKQLAELQNAQAQRELVAQERILRSEVRAEAIKAGLNPQLAAKLIDFSQVETDDNGDPTNIAELLASAIKDYGLATGNAAPQGASGAPRQSAGGATNPPRAGGPLTVTANQYLDKAFQQQFRATHGMDVMTAVRLGKATII